MRVRPLDWHEDFGPSRRARTVKGLIAYPHTRGWNYEIKIGKTFRLFLSGTEISRHTDLESAKAAAQADYDMRIRAALIDQQPAEARQVSRVECPWCGSTDALIYGDTDSGGTCVQCDNCGIQGPGAEPGNREEAMRLWKDRAAPASVGSRAATKEMGK